MLHLHLKECDSTQLYLKENFKDLFLKDSCVLISTDKQLKGIGRNGHRWDDYPNALTFSFLLRPSINVITIPLAVGIILCEYVKEKWATDLNLKWPNDLINCQYQKCGGIICQYVDHESVICGVGLNLGFTKKLSEEQNYKTPAGVINANIKLSGQDRKVIPKNIYDYFLSYDFSKLNIKNNFEQFCYHINKQVSITDTNQEWVGIFQGISDNGEAILKGCDGKINTFISGSLNVMAT